jgi:hypothetical protein
MSYDPNVPNALVMLGMWFRLEITESSVPDSFKIKTYAFAIISPNFVPEFPLR